MGNYTHQYVGGGYPLLRGKSCRIISPDTPQKAVLVDFGNGIHRQVSRHALKKINNRSIGNFELAR